MKFAFLGLALLFSVSTFASEKKEFATFENPFQKVREVLQTLESAGYNCRGPLSIHGRVGVSEDFYECKKSDGSMINGLRVTPVIESECKLSEETCYSHLISINIQVTRIVAKDKYFSSSAIGKISDGKLNLENSL